MTLRVRRRLIGLPLAATIVYLFATNSQVVWLYVIAAMILALTVLGALAPAVILRRARLEYVGLTREGFVPPLRQDAGKIFVGDTVRVHFRHGGDPGQLTVGPLLCADGSEWPVQVHLAQAGQLTVIGHAGRRGEVRLTGLRVESSWPIGVISVKRTLPLDRAFVVHPRYALPSGHEARGATPGLEEAVQRGPGLDFIGVREYRPGDGLRQIHWATTARRGVLMVVETAVESQNPARYALTLSPLAAADVVELGVSVAASLAAGRAAGAQPFRLQLPGNAGSVHQWGEALAALAHARPASAAPVVAGRAFDTGISAGGDGLVIETAEGDVRLAAGTGLEEALAALAEVT